MALIDLDLERGAKAAARAHAEQLLNPVPDDPSAQALYQQFLK